MEHHSCPLFFSTRCFEEGSIEAKINTDRGPEVSPFPPVTLDEIGKGRVEKKVAAIAKTAI